MRKVLPLIAASLAAAAMFAGPVIGQGAQQTVGITRVDPSTVTRGFRASKVIGATVYNDKGDTIGKIDDMIVSPDGKAPYAVLSVGGFLGAGAHLVVVRYQDLIFANNRVTLLGGTKEQLQSLPGFNYTG